MNRMLLSAGFIVLAGLVTLSSISTHLFYLQLIWVALGLAVVILCRAEDWSGLLRSRWFVWGIYALTILLLVVVLVKSPAVRNKHSWLVLGPFTLQPVELAKVALVLTFAGFLSRRHVSIGRFRTILISFGIFIVPAVLTLLQPDLGSASILFGIWFGFLLVSGLPRKWLIAAAIVLVLGSAVGWYGFLKTYQKERIAGFFNPERNALTYNYQVNQSKIAIGSAGLWGKGYKQGTQVQLGFLAESSTDFVFASLTEEWGIAGAFLVLAAFLVLIFEMLKAGLNQSSNFEHFVVLGVAIVFGLQFWINAGSATGLFPVVGVTFPFLSYGGSSILADSLLLGIVYTIQRKQSI